LFRYKLLIKKGKYPLNLLLLKFKNMYNNDNYQLRNELGNYVKNYSINNYGKDWSYCIGLSNKYDVRNNKWRNNISYLFKNIKKIDENIDGFIFNEYDVNYSNIHHHIILKSDLKEEDINKVIKKNWKNRGLSEIEKYDEKKDYCYYISKHYNKMKENEFELILNLI
jgi:hypothetical protein